MGFVEKVKNVISKLRAEGKTEKEVSEIIEQAAEAATVLKKTESPEHPEKIKAAGGENLQDALLKVGISAKEALTAFESIYRLRRQEKSNNWRKYHGLPLKRSKGGKRRGDRKRNDRIQKTQVYLENYREIERYIKDAISEVSQIDDVSRYNISAEKAFLQSIRECKAETFILFEHMKKALASLKEDAEAAGEGYKYDALEAVYIKGKSYEDIVRETGCGKNSPKKWCRSMTERLSIKLFGAKAIENDKIGVK